MVCLPRGRYLYLRHAREERGGSRTGARATCGRAAEMSLFRHLLGTAYMVATDRLD